jgi:mannitol/fructose-specific phosphotransferase system IIA component (Ntr-type)
MSDSRPDQTPKTQPASAGGPPRPPKKTARGLGDGFPDDFFGPGVDIVDLQAHDRWQVIEELVSHLVATRKIQSQHRDSLAESIRKRESSMSTGIGFGVGIPHASTALVSEVVTVVGRSRQGIQFDALDSKPVHLVLLFWCQRVSSRSMFTFLRMSRSCFIGRIFAMACRIVLCRI